MEKACVVDGRTAGATLHRIYTEHKVLMVHSLAQAMTLLTYIRLTVGLNLN